jgi:hypothetical protein
MRSAGHIPRQFREASLVGPHNRTAVTTEPLTIDRLGRWAAFGAHWRVVDLSLDHAVVDLCACTGELVERAVCDDAAVIMYLRTAQTDQD